MRFSTRVPILLAILLLAFVTGHAQEAATTTVNVQVTDQTGASVVGAELRLVPAPDPAPGKLVTDQTGRAALHLATGSYALFVLAPGFKRGEQHIQIPASPSVAASTLVLPIVLHVADVGSPTVYPKDSLVLTAEPYHLPVVLSPTEFAALPHVSLTVHNAHSNADETYSGVPLATLLAKIGAPLGKELHGEALARYVLASGSDGYAVVLSIAEVDPSFHGGQIIVADARDGKSLGDYGPFQLIVSDDKRPARWVHNLNGIALVIAH